MSDSAPITEPPFGAKKRDWTLLYRAVVLFLGIVGTSLAAGALYAGRAAIREQVQEEMNPIATKTAQEFARYLLKESYALDQSVIGLRVANLERTAQENRSRIDENQRTLLERQHRLELMIIEGFSKQGITITTPRGSER